MQSSNSDEIRALFRQTPARYPELRGQVAIVTGGSRGIGLGIAVRLAREGMRLVLAGLEENEVAESVDALRGEGAEVQPVVGDLGQDSVIDALFEKTLSAYGTLNLLVNNAADLRRVRVADLTPQLIDDQLNVNLRMPMVCSVRAAEIMRPARAGNIINLSSVGGLRAQLPGMPYSVTKHAIEGLTRVLAMDLAEYGIRVNGIAPGWTPHRITAESHPDYFNHQAAYIPLRTAGRPEDIGAAVAFLASPDASYITGATLMVDGGLSMQLHPPEHPI